jgi:hypothetical protein
MASQVSLIEAFWVTMESPILSSFFLLKDDFKESSASAAF